MSELKKDEAVQNETADKKDLIKRDKVAKCLNYLISHPDFVLPYDTCLIMVESTDFDDFEKHYPTLTYKECELKFENFWSFKIWFHKVDFLMQHYEIVENDLLNASKLK